MNGLITGRNEAVGAESLKQRVVSATATLTPEDRVVLVDCSKTFTLTLCPVSECPGALIYIKGFGSGGAVTVATPTGGMLATPKFTVDDLTAATDYKLILNVHGVEYVELAEVTT
jgi:hypothetical protein